MLESLILRYDVSFHYDSSLYVVFDDFVECSGGNGLMEEGMKDMLGYSNNIVGTSKKNINKMGILVRLNVRMIVRN